MPYFVKIPKRVGSAESELDSESYLNIINGDGTLIQRELRRRGYGGYEPSTAATMCAVFDMLQQRKLFPRSNDNTSFSFYDVGANGGLYSFLCKCLFRDEVEVTAFEPAPDSYKWLSAINQVNHLKITTEQVAVSDNTDNVTLYLSAKSDASNSLNASFRVHKGSVSVQCVTLDGYIDSSNRRPDFLKIDTETHEEEVLQGGLNFIRKYRPVLILEAINKDGIDYGAKIAGVLDEVGGFRYYKIGEGNSLTKHDTITAQERTEFRDWLISPVELDEEFFSLVESWAEALSVCTVKTNIAGTTHKSKSSPANSQPPRVESAPEQGSRGIASRLRAAVRAFTE